MSPASRRSRARCSTTAGASPRSNWPRRPRAWTSWCCSRPRWNFPDAFTSRANDISMTAWLRRRGWTACKWLLAAAILAFVGRQFYANLTQLDLAELSLRPGWLALSAALYVGGLSASAWFWHHLLRVFGQRPRASATIKA